MDQRLQDPAGAAPPDWRGLCEELAGYLQGRKDRECGWPGEDPEQDLLDRARAALAQPEHEVVGPSDEELDELFTEIDQSGEALSWRAFARAALARWGHQPAPPAAGEVGELVRQLGSMAADAEAADFVSDAALLNRAIKYLERQAAPVPVAVSERPWEREGWCHPQERWAWFYNRRVGWRDAIPPASLKPPTMFPYTHSLPFNALPLPSGEATAAEIDGAQATGSTH